MVLGARKEKLMKNETVFGLFGGGY